MWYNISVLKKELIVLGVSFGKKGGVGKRLTTADMTLTAAMTSIIAICAWITVRLPFTDISFTMQLFGVFLALTTLGRVRGTFAILVYILIGATGLPVFSGFTGGAAALTGMTGGYITGFIFIALSYCVITKLFGEKLLPTVISLIIGTALCYAFGTAWFIHVYTGKVGSISIMAALAKCVFPFIIPDCIKLALAVTLSRKIKRYAKL